MCLTTIISEGSSMIHSHPRFPPDCLPKLQKDRKKRKRMRQTAHLIFSLMKVISYGADYYMLQKKPKQLGEITVQKILT